MISSGHISVAKAAQGEGQKCKPCPQRHAWSVRSSARCLGSAASLLNVAFSPCGSAVGRGVRETRDDFPCADGQRIPRRPCTRYVCPIPRLRSHFDPQIRRADRCIRAEASARGKVGIASSVRAPTCARACVYFEWRARSTAILLILPSFRKSSPMWHWWAACSSTPAVLLPSYTGTDLTQQAVTGVKFKWHFCGKKYETLQKSDVEWIVEVASLAPLEPPKSYIE